MTYVFYTYIIKEGKMATASEIKRRIRRETNCYFLREGSNHEIWVNPDTGEKFQIPRHPGQEVKTGTARRIYKKAGIIKDET